MRNAITDLQAKIRDNHGNYVSWIHQDFREAWHHATKCTIRHYHTTPTILGVEGMSLYEAIDHEGDSAHILASWDDLVIVSRPSSRGPLREEWLPGVDYAAKVMPDGRVWATPARAMYDTDWRGVRCINPYKGGR